MTKGIEYLLSLSKDAPTYDGLTIRDAFEQIKHSKVDPTILRKSLKEQVSKRLVTLGYWDFIPIPKVSEEEENETLEES